MARNRTARPTVLIIGLGRFGSAVAETLVNQDVEVLCVDEDAERVQHFAGQFTHTVQADATDGDAMRQLGVGQFDRAVVAIGNDIEASVLAVITLVEAGVEQIWAKAITRKHGKILDRIGATHVIYPELMMGQRVGHMVTGLMNDYIEFEGGYAIARTYAPPETWAKTLGESAIRTRHRITVVGVKRPGDSFTYALPDTPVARGDELIVAGTIPDVERFSSLQARRHERP
ncbi:TrkA family potassium uptake protein [Ornithinimicrobium ciconiae]|uniref:TrkA family potassium uptake protein n=1 Tax=Ornithinimicrobium ciconiae TaxID=2594265 RepID=A0A516GAL5_9MICO|nr:TrkA family potassium uptake protein [Ornithinimicrobium ciconiae]QDO88542.1 TrkA family potassium uptake protein [Ornithinimicrobium ciconiae]